MRQNFHIGKVLELTEPRFPLDMERNVPLKVIFHIATEIAIAIESLNVKCQALKV